VRLVQAFGWHDALRILGVAIVVIALPFALFVREAPPSGRAAATTKTPDSKVPIADVVRQPAFYLLMFGSMCSIAAVGGANQHLKLYLSLDHSYSQQAAAEIASLTLAASLVGRLLMGWLADRWPKKRVMLLIYLLVAAALPIPLLATTKGAIMLYAVVFGIGLGGEYMVIPLMAAELFGVRVLGRAMGLILAADGVAEALAPVAVGRLHDVSGNYVTGFSLLIGFAIAGAIAISLLPSRGARTPNLAMVPERA
jgi:nitrate/nitrite transporter NarK